MINGISIQHTYPTHQQLCHAGEVCIMKSQLRQVQYKTKKNITKSKKLSIQTKRKNLSNKINSEITNTYQRSLHIRLHYVKSLIWYAFAFISHTPHTHESTHKFISERHIHLPTHSIRLLQTRALGGRSYDLNSRVVLRPWMRLPRTSRSLPGTLDLEGGRYFIALTTQSSQWWFRGYTLVPQLPWKEETGERETGRCGQTEGKCSKAMVIKSKVIMSGKGWSIQNLVKTVPSSSSSSSKSCSECVMSEANVTVWTAHRLILLHRCCLIKAM